MELYLERVRTNAVDTFIENMKVAYYQKFNTELLSYKVQITNGVEEMRKVAVSV